jgi:uncharacterized protein YbdZ (MbtH family)
MFYEVIINHEGCYSLWPMGEELAAGWSRTGFASSAEVALNQVAELWRTTVSRPPDECDLRSERPCSEE